MPKNFHWGKIEVLLSAGTRVHFMYIQYQRYASPLCHTCSIPDLFYLFFLLWKNYLLVSILVPSMSGQAMYMYVFQTNQIEATMSSKFNCRLQRYLFSLWMQVLYTCINKCCSQSHTVFPLKGSLESILRYSYWDTLCQNQRNYGWLSYEWE